MLKFVTSNRCKFREFRELSSRFGVDLEMTELTYPEIQSDDLAKIALESARHCAKALGLGFFVEDAGLFVNALRGFPGPYSSFVHATIGNQGILDLMREGADRSAFFLSAICHYDGEFHTYEGRVEGAISRRCRGKAGFGFDPIFIPSGYRSTFAELGRRKNEISHRARSSEIFFRTLAKGDPKKVL